MKPIPLFDFAETEQVAARVRFTPKRPGPAQECLLDTQRTAWNFPEGLSEQQRFQAHFYIALGLFIWGLYGEQGKPVLAEILDWYEVNTGLTTDETFFISGFLQ